MSYSTSYQNAAELSRARNQIPVLLRLSLHVAVGVALPPETPRAFFFLVRLCHGRPAPPCPRAAAGSSIQAGRADAFAAAGKP